jgi:phosphoadenosine phosphosulfate reductase
MNDFEKKVEISRTRIRAVLRDHNEDKCAVACSFGKDSMAVLYLVREVAPNILVEFTNTGVEFPETLQHRDRVVKEWNLNYVEAQNHDTNFWKIVEEYGWPDIRWNGSRGSHGPKCCDLLKEQPAWECLNARGIKCIFTGITAAESRNRWMLQRRCGDYYYTKTQGFWKCHPIMDWTEEEVWQFTKENQIPVNPFYERCPNQRVGCMPCSGYLHWEAKMAEAFPKMYRLVQKRRGQVLIDDAEGFA